MKKGMVADNIYLAMTLIVVFMVMGALLFNMFSTAKTLTLERTENAYVLVNALKAARLFTEASLDLSVYQAVYNNSKYGGYYDISQLPDSKKMTNELMPLCESEMKRFTGCDASDSGQSDKITTGMKYDGQKYFNTRPAGLLQCILARMRDKDDGSIYYDLRSYALQSVRQIDCDFGEVTDKGLRSFQEDYGLAVTGEVDDDTLQKLKEVFASKYGDCGKFFDGCEDNVKTMVFWETISAGTSPDEQKIYDDLKSALVNEMAKYTASDYSFMDEYVNLPAYDDGIGVEKSRDSSLLNITLASNDMLSVTKQDNLMMERLNLRVSPNISREYPIRYLDFYGMAVETFSNVITEAGKKTCISYIPGDKLMHNKLVSGFVVDAEVFNIKDAPCSLVVRVSLKDETKTFPVFNGREVAFEPVVFEFLVSVA